MILSLCSPTQTVRIEMPQIFFSRLRDPAISAEEISAIAQTLNVPQKLLEEYVLGIPKEDGRTHEVDASCDYTDHFF